MLAPLGRPRDDVDDPERGLIFGTRFSVWAPNAQAVRLVGDFNYWNGEGHYMHLIPGAGVWALFVEGREHRQPLQVRGAGCRRCVAAQGRPDGAIRRGCAAHRLDRVREPVRLGDDDWMWYRGQKAMHAEPMSVYEAHRIVAARAHLPRAGQRTGRVRHLAGLHACGIHARCPAPIRGSWGYHVTGYFAPMSKFGLPMSSGTSSTGFIKPGSA